MDSLVVPNSDLNLTPPTLLQILYFFNLTKLEDMKYYNLINVMKHPHTRHLVILLRIRKSALSKSIAVPRLSSTHFHTMLTFILWALVGAQIGMLIPDHPMKHPSSVWLLKAVNSVATLDLHCILIFKEPTQFCLLSPIFAEDYRLYVSIFNSESKVEKLGPAISSFPYIPTKLELPVHLKLQPLYTESWIELTEKLQSLRNLSDFDICFYDIEFVKYNKNESADKRDWSEGVSPKTEIIMDTGELASYGFLCPRITMISLCFASEEASFYQCKESKPLRSSNIDQEIKGWLSHEEIINQSKLNKVQPTNQTRVKQTDKTGISSTNLRDFMALFDSNYS